MTETKLQLTTNQQNALEQIQVFANNHTHAFILKGYAGTGKTTLLKLITEQFQSQGMLVSLMAPTGRAAKILREKTGLKASTIHSGIYDYSDVKEVKIADEDGADSFRYFFDLKPNDSINNRVFIIDESSMISDDFAEGEFFRFGSGKLLRDLIEFTRIQHPLSGNKLIFVGDPAQLAPPTKSDISPALSDAYLSETYSLKTEAATLFQVVRQVEGSGILTSAERIRKGIDLGFFNQFKVPENPQDIHYVPSGAFFDMYENAPGKKIIIAYTNQTAYQINLDVRQHKYGGSYPIRVGDVMLIGQNNHLTGLFNGEFGVINRCDPNPISRELVFKVAGGATAHVLLKWYKIELAFQNEQGLTATQEMYMLDNYLHGKMPTLKPEEQQALYVDFKNRHNHLKPGTEEFKKALRSDLFFNALRLRYGFAVTCHKAQGGEWDNAFIFWDYARSGTFNIWKDKQEKTGRNNSDFFRWAYTAITRASKTLYCINPPSFTPYHGLVFVSPASIAGIQHLNGETINVTKFEIDQDMMDTIDRLGLPKQPEALRTHFLSVYYQCKESNIAINGWKLNGYEFNYDFRQGDKKAAIKGWINGKNIINPTYQKNPGGTNSDELFTAVHQICQGHARFQAEVQQAENPAALPASIDWSIATEKPFLHQLYVDIQEILGNLNIAIVDVTHLEYKDRYTFERNGEKAILDVEYNGNGFFGRVLPLAKPAPAPLLLQNLESAFLTLKNL
jgi:hypothetical protein